MAETVLLNAFNFSQNLGDFINHNNYYKLEAN